MTGLQEAIVANLGFVLVGLVAVAGLLVAYAIAARGMFGWRRTHSLCEAVQGESCELLGGSVRIHVEDVRDAGSEGLRSVAVLVDAPGSAQQPFEIQEGGKVQYFAKGGHYYEVTVRDIVADTARFRAERFVDAAHVRDWDAQDEVPVPGPESKETTPV